MSKEIAGYQLPKTPDDNQAMVYVVRPSGIGSLVRFNVFLDDRKDDSEMGWTRGGQHIYFYVQPGTHTISSKAENWDEIKVTAKSGSVVYIRQDPSMGFIMARNSLVKIDEIEGKYHVMKTSQGEVIKTEK
ncbi:MAG: DUF2846 domain-containing protein [Bdellovibrionales bacterium]|nr:DUF2846 domain-containing protein [Bdellovibrionales bacterium]MBT3524906.1 DUF2846 domain-containing protein [Bdellovibrionales bacterium]MBT7668104.1 DUF2846 domain-containing protein [Bdellovibrionales bacterium]MBT7766798.1 DUF2846 domain-containing protein [Bdellovibrionales bacterium]